VSGIDYQAQRDALLALIETQGDAELMRIAWRIAGWPYAPIQVPDDSALEALADRMVAKRRPACEGGLYGAPTDCKCATCAPTGRVGGAPRPCCHTTGPLHHPACQERQ
jgi:hypothetical protein